MAEKKIKMIPSEVLAFIEAGKEFVRVILIAAIPVAIEQLTAGEFNYRLIVVAGLIAGLRAVEKYLYEYGKQNGRENPVSNFLKFE